MEIIILLAVVGILSTIVLGGLATSEKIRPYALSVLAASGVAALVVQGQAVGSERNLIGAWPIYFFVMFCVQVLAAPIAFIAFVARKSKHSQRPNESLDSKTKPEQKSNSQTPRATAPLNKLPKAANKAENLHLISTLNALRSALTTVVSGLPSANTSKAEFSNAASALFCQARLLASTQLEDLAANVERVLVKLQRGSLDVGEANRLLNALSVEIERLE